tara:strand:+ start:406 stop:597 length:192 start_codon:yes stop_codon:yes gene_type:complete
MKIYEPGQLKRIEDEKRRKEERLRKVVRLEHTTDGGVVGIWDAVYKEGSVPEAKYSVQYYTPK